MQKIILIYLLAFSAKTFAQLPDSCKLNIGTNLGGLSDYGTELPFVDLMHNCREWYTKDIPSNSFNSGNANLLSYRTDGYPTHIPQIVGGVALPQKVATIWGLTDGWATGTYTILYDGSGNLSLSGGITNIVHVSSNKITFDYAASIGNAVELIIDSSLAGNPICNIRVLMPGSEFTYSTQPFNPQWLNKLAIFKSVRFMDWFATNNWGQPDSYTWDDSTYFNWNDRAKMNYYTWSNRRAKYGSLCR